MAAWCLVTVTSGRARRQQPWLYPPHMTLTLILLGVLGFAVVLFGGLDAYQGRMREDPRGSGLFTIPDHQGRSLAVTIIGALVSFVCLLLSLSK
jgi:hypothetical protein